MTSRPLALVTGASTGVGLELARRFADAGYDLVIAAEDAGVEDAAAELRGAGVAVDAVRVDLATRDGVEELYRRATASGRPIAVAAVSDLDVSSTVHLAKRMVRDMVELGEGRILFASSDAGQAGYGASRSFVQSFALALREELDGGAVTVTSMAETLDATAADGDGHGAAEAARIGFEALMADRPR
jgi:uncharacterized protein